MLRLRYNTLNRPDPTLQQRYNLPVLTSTVQSPAVHSSYRVLQAKWLLFSIMFMTILLFATARAAAQLQTTQHSLHPDLSAIQGTVTGKNSTPLTGVRVITIPYHDATYSDAKGHFKLKITGRTKKIEFSKAGYQTRSIKVTDRNLPWHIQLNALPLKDSSAPGATHKDAVSTGKGKPALWENVPGIAVVGSTAEIKAIGGLRIRGRGGNRLTMTGLVLRGANHYSGNSTESYAHEKENGFKSARTSPLSTFSIDVDKAAYSNIRRFINEGNLPPADAVRIEELINYFGYHYGQPTGKDPVRIKTELSTAPWNPSHYLLHIGLQAKKVATDDLPPSNLVFLIDVSGSMFFANKLPLVVSSFKMLTDQLRPQDYVSIVTYAGNAQNVLTPTSGAHKEIIKGALDKLRASGSTNGAGGLEKAYVMAEKHFKKAGNNRIILASDGDFNVGTSSTPDLERLITEKRKSGIYLTVLGFGMGNFKDDKMETLADKGNGNYAYIDNSAEARRVLLKEFGGTLFTVAKDVKVQLEFNPAVVKAYRLVGYENRALADQDFNRDTVDAGEMGSGSTVTALYEIIPRGVNDAYTPTVDTMRYVFSRLTKTGGALDKELGMIKIRYKDPHGSKSKLLQTVIPDAKVAPDHSSANFQLAAAAAGWGMLLKNSPYLQGTTYKVVTDLIKKPLEEDKTGQIGEFLNLVQTSQALVGNEVKTTDTQINPPLFSPRPRPHQVPVPIPSPGPKRKKPPVAKIIPIQDLSSVNG